MASPFTAFPTFGGPEQGGGITSIKMNPAQVRFPTARRPAPQRRPLEPTNKEKFAPLAPFVVGGIIDMFKGTPETLSDDLYLESINADPTDPSKVEQASLDAYKLYGPRAETNTFGMDEVANIVAAGLSGRGAPAYATTYLNKRNAEAKVDAAKEVSRSAFIKQQLLDKKIPFENYIDTASLEAGLGRVERTGYQHPDFGLIINDPENPNAIQKGPYKGYVLQENIDGNFVKSGTYNEDRIQGYKNPDIKSMMDGAREFNAKDAVTFDTILTLNSLVDTLQNSEGESLALAGGVLSVIADDVDTNLSAIANSMGLGRNPQALFSTTEDGGNFKGTGNRIAELKILTDQRRQLVASEQDTTELDVLILEKFEAYNASMLETGDKRFGFTMFDKGMLEKNAFERVSAMSDYISLGYLVAGARFGQTGRTLSDKDLAFIADDVDTNLSAIANSMGLGRNPQALFSTTEDGGNFKGTGNRIAELKILTDQRRQMVDSGQDTTEQDVLILEKFEAYNAAMLETGDKRFGFTMFDKGMLEKNAFERVSAMSDYISLGYLVAGARFGQTGRTLSDKDLAFALQSIGFGATQNKNVAKALLLKVGNSMIDSVDTKSRYIHNPQNYMGLKRNENYINAFSNYWQPPTDEEGVVDWDSDPKDWKYIGIEQRAINRLGENEDGSQINPIKKFRSFKSDLFNVNEERAKPQVYPNINQMQNNLLNKINAGKG